MDCLSEEVLQDLVDGVLTDSAAAQAIKHIRSCDRCRQEFAEILALYEGVRVVVAADACPPKATLAAYTQNALPHEAMATVRKHMEFCSECHSHVWLLTASESELAKWQAEEERAHREYEARSVGRDAAREALSSLLPVGLEFLDRLWDSACALVLNLRAKRQEQWPRVGSAEQLTGALGFAGPVDPEATATAIILISTLFVAERIAGDEIGTSGEEIAAAVREAARAFGAGKELEQRLAETLPAILRRFYGPSDARPCV